MRELRSAWTQTRSRSRPRPATAPVAETLDRSRHQVSRHCCRTSTTTSSLRAVLVPGLSPPQLTPRLRLASPAAFARSHARGPPSDLDSKRAVRTKFARQRGRRPLLRTGRYFRVIVTLSIFGTRSGTATLLPPVESRWKSSR